MGHDSAPRSPFDKVFEQDDSYKPPEAFKDLPWAEYILQDKKEIKKKINGFIYELYRFF